MKRIVIFIFIGLLVSGFLYAEGKQEAKGVEEGEPVELVYWSHYGQSPPFVHAFADTANKILPEIGYPNVKVKAEVIEYQGFEVKYLSAFAAGKGPDMFCGMAPVWAGAGGKHEVAVPLPDDVAKVWDENLADYLKAWGTHDGKRYGFAAEGIIQMLYINAGHFNEVGLNPDDPPQTVDEFVAAAKKLTQKDSSGNITRAGYAPRHVGHGFGVADKFMPILHIFGGRMLNKDLDKAEGYINGPNSVNAFQWYQDLVEEYEVVNLDFGKPEPTFQRGQTSMIFREGWFGADTKKNAPNIDFEVAPYISGRESYAPSNLLPWANMISKNSDYQEVCFQLFKEMCTPEADVMLHEPAGYPPILKGTYTMDNSYFASLSYAEALMKSLEKPVGPSYFFPEIQDVAYIVGEEMVSCLHGTAAQDAADTAAERIDKVLAGME
jgi:fructooligosaccharide transport system substrate-binding protein